MKWVILLILAVGGFFIFQNRDEIGSYWQQTIAQLNHAPRGKKKTAVPRATATTGQPVAGNGGSAPAARAPATPAWTPRTIGRLQVNLPWDLQPYTPPDMGSLPSVLRVENYKHQSGPYMVALMHGENTALRGGLMLTWADRVVALAAERVKMDVISTNTATTLLNGFRARRSDFVSRTSPRIRARVVLLEKGNQAWFIEYHAPESDPNAETTFLQMADSARAF